MKIPETFTGDLDRIARGEAPAPTDDAEHAALLATAQRLADGVRPLREAPPGVQERLEARLTAQLPAAARRWHRPVIHLRPLRRWQTVVGLATAAALVLALVGAAFTWFGPSQPVSAQAILDQAQQTAAQDAAPSGVTSYHLTETRTLSVKLPGGTMTRETWYAGSDRQRTDEQVTGKDGTVVSSSGQIFNGVEMWNYDTDENGQTRVIHTTGTQWTPPSDTDPSQGGSVADLIAQYNQNDKACQTATQQGRSTVAGRSVYVIVLTPKQDGCGGRSPDVTSQAKEATAIAMKATAAADSTRTADQNAAKAKAVTANAGQAAGGNPGQVKLGQMTVWVDTQTFLPLKVETKATDGTVLDQGEVTSIQYNAQIPDSTFAYTPPANATVYTSNNLPPQNVKATIGAADGKNSTPPAKKP
jgi:outer membrane lipoprotein-sorting protein